MKVAYTAFLRDSSGFGEAGRRMLRVLQTLDVDLAPGLDLSDGGWQVPMSAEVLEFLRRRPHAEPDVHIYFVAAADLPKILRQDRQDGMAVPILMTCWETDKLHPKAVEGAKLAQVVIVPSRQNAKVFSAVHPRVAVVPYPIVRPPGEPKKLDLFVGRDDVFVFYSVMTWQERKNPLGLLTAYMTGFTGSQPVELVIKVSGGHPAEALSRAQRDLETHIRALNLPDPPTVKIYGGQATEDALWALHARGECYVSLTRGEAFGLPMLDALASGNQLIATGWGGHRDFAAPYGATLIPYRMTPVVQSYPHFDGSQHWADADIVEARQAMVQAFHAGRDDDRERVWSWIEHRPALQAMLPESVGQALRAVIHGD